MTFSFERLDRREIAGEGLL